MILGNINLKKHVNLTQHGTINGVNNIKFKHIKRVELI